MIYNFTELGAQFGALPVHTVAKINLLFPGNHLRLHLRIDPY